MASKGKRTKCVTYYRVSTGEQGRSGLGLEAQRRAVLDYLDGNGWEIVEEYTEIESGKRNDRPELLKALTQCRLRRATLVIAKLDRLARNVAFISNLMDSGVDFRAVDFPEANRLTVHILAAVAEHEAQMISQRTKDALAAAKSRGVKLGNDNLTDAIRAMGRQASARVIAERARKRAALVTPTIKELRAGGTNSLRALALALNDKGIPAPRGGKWYASSVRNALALADDNA